MSNGQKSLEDIRFVPTKKIQLSKIKFDKKNPNVLSKEKTIALKNTVNEFGFADDPWINDLNNGTYLVIDGEHRIRLLLQQGVKYAQCKVFKVKYVEVQMLRQIANKLRGEHDSLKDAMEFKDIFKNDKLSDFAKYIGQAESEFREAITQSDNLNFKPDDIITDNMDNENTLNVTFSFKKISEYESVLQTLREINTNKETALLTLIHQA